MVGSRDEISHKSIHPLTLIKNKLLSCQTVLNRKSESMSNMQTSSYIFYKLYFTGRRDNHYEFFFGGDFHSLLRWRDEKFILLPVLVPMSLNLRRFVFVSHLTKVLFLLDGFFVGQLDVFLLNNHFFHLFNFLGFLYFLLYLILILFLQSQLSLLLLEFQLFLKFFRIYFFLSFFSAHSI